MHRTAGRIVSALLVTATLLPALGSNTSAQAGRQPAPPFSPRDYDTLPRPAARPMTPAQRDAAGARLRHAHSVYDQQCDLTALTRSLGPGLLPGQQVTRPASESYPARRATQEAGAITLQISTLMQHLEDNGDPVVLRHHVCVGIFDMLPSSPNAFAHADGFIMVDPRLIIRLNRIKMPLLSAFEKFVYFHEFAHSLQFWHPLLRFNDPTVRRAELAADCVAGGLVRSANEGGDFAQSMWQQGFAETAAIYGDDDVTSRHHHGRPAERVTAVMSGVAIVSNRLRTTGGATTGITGDWLLRQCNATLT